MNRFYALLLLLLAAYSGWNGWQNREVSRAPGILAAEPPRQINLPAQTAPVFHVNNYTLKAQASYTLQARLLLREPYHWGRDSELSPLDFVLGWGPMSDSTLLAKLSISQSGRFYHVRWQDSNVSSSQVMRHSANTHMIPATPYIAKRLASMRVGQLVELSGYLVNATAPDGWHWQTSMTRDDVGNGACELFWVEKALVIN